MESAPRLIGYLALPDGSLLEVGPDTTICSIMPQGDQADGDGPASYAIYSGGSASRIMVDRRLEGSAFMAYQHARIGLHDDMRYIQSFGNINGTFLWNSERKTWHRIDDRLPTPLADETTICFGGKLLAHFSEAGTQFWSPQRPRLS